MNKRKKKKYEGSKKIRCSYGVNYKTINIYQGISVRAVYDLATKKFNYFTLKKPNFQPDIDRFLGVKRVRIKKEYVKKHKSYKDYLHSDVWRGKREKKLKEVDDRCQLCYSPDKLQVHHRTYDRIFNERLGDLIVLCKDCHETFHSKFWDDDIIESKSEELLRNQKYI